MAAPAPKTDKWTARENTQGEKGKLGIVLLVTGLVEVTSTNKEPVLTEASGGAYGKTLVLDLTIRSAGGTDLQVLVWKRATFSKDVSADHYDNVEIRWEGKAIATVKVLNDDEHHQHLSDLTQKANKTAPPPKLRPAPKKAAPKKAAPKKAAPKKTVHPEPKKRPPAAKKKAATAKKAKKRSAAAAKKRPSAKKRGGAKKRTGAKKRSPMKKLVSAAKKMLRGAKKRPAAKKRTGAKKRSARRR
jgi:hypothetical protein